MNNSSDDVFDPNQEGLIPIRQVPAYLQSLGGRRVHLSTVYRWILAGVNGRKLEAIKLGGQTYTSKPALHRFAASMQEGGRHVKATRPVPGVMSSRGDGPRKME